MTAADLEHLSPVSIAGETTPAVRTVAAATRTAPAYAIDAADAAGHMRKLEELEAEIIRMAIARYHGRMSEVARRLGIGRSTLYRKLKDLGLEEAVAPEADSEGDAASRVA